jgi:hypothetical protein
MEVGSGISRDVSSISRSLRLLVFSFETHKTGYQAQIVSINAIDPGEASVTIEVQNVGDRAGAPICEIDLSSPAGAYTGYDELNAPYSVPKRGRASFMDTITVTNQGASYVELEASSVTCS